MGARWGAAVRAPGVWRSGKVRSVWPHKHGGWFVVGFADKRYRTLYGAKAASEAKGQWRCW